MEKIIRKILEEGLDIDKGTRVLILFDNSKWEIAEKISVQSNKLGARTETQEISASNKTFAEPPKDLITPMKSQDVFISVTTNDFTLSKAVKEARDKGTKIANMAEISEDIMYACDVDYSEIQERGDKLRKKIKRSKKGRVISSEGTDLSFETGNREVNVESGLCHYEGGVCTYPPGEVSFTPVEETVNGDIVVTRARGESKEMKKSYEVKKGKIMNPKGLQTDEVGEIGIGFNPKIELKKVYPHDLKKDGTMHIGIGANFHLGGEIWGDKHHDISIGEAELELD